jgi:hypothetical protein
MERVVYFYFDRVPIESSVDVWYSIRRVIALYETRYVRATLIPITMHGITVRPLAITALAFEPILNKNCFHSRTIADLKRLSNNLGPRTVVLFPLLIVDARSHRLSAIRALAIC